MESKMATSNLEIFNTRKEKVQNLISESIKIYETLGMKTNAEKAGKSLEKVQKDDFKAIVIGEFKRGKSTFINALLGDEILPAFATPCTAVINEVKYADKEKAVLHFKDPLPQDADYSFKEEVKNHINRNGKTNIPPLPIDVKDLEEYVVIPDPAKDQRLSVSESPYSKVELFYPIEICKNGVTIIDSPGLNEHGTRTKVTTDYLSQVDAILFVMSCQALCSQTEMDFIENKISLYGHEEIFFICNRFDEVRERERARVVSYAKTKLAPLTTFGEAGIFFVSAADALDGRLEGNQELVEKSGMLPFEDNLNNFFINERGRIKLFQPIKELLSEYKECINKEIPMQSKMLESNTEEIQKRYEEALPQLENLKKKKEQMMQRIELKCQKLKDNVQAKSNLKIREIADMLQKMGQEYKPKNEIKFISLKGTNKQIEILTHEISEYLRDAFEKEQDKWAQSELLGLITSTIDEIKSDLDDSMNQFIDDIAVVKADISGIQVENPLEQKKIGGLERVISGGIGLVIGGAGSAMIGATMGKKEMLKSLGPALGIQVAALLIGITNPVVLIGLLFGGGFVQGLLKSKSATDDVKNKIITQFVSKIKEESIEMSKRTADSVYEQTQGFSKAIEASLNNELNSVKQTVDKILSDKKSGEQEVALKKQNLQQISAELTAMQNELTGIIMES